jgi:hypothetical protein
MNTPSLPEKTTSAHSPQFPYQVRNKIGLKHYSIRFETQHVHGGDSTVFPGLS